MRVWAAALVGVVLAACLPTHQLIGGDDAAPPNNNLNDSDGAVRFDVDLGDPFAILGLSPSHGSFKGGTRTVVSGRGFSSTLRVFVGGAEVPPSDVFASDPSRAAITTPPGAPGPADVRVRIDATAQERVLPQGFLYDAIALTPDSGATTGGTIVAIEGSGTTWAAGTTVTIDGLPCADVNVTDATHLECTTPADAPGAKDVVVTAPDTSVVSAREAFTYSDSNDGYRGGLSGGALAGKLKVLVLDSWTGFPVAGAKAIAGSVAQGALVATTDQTGAATINDSSLTGAVTVTVGEKCHQPMTFVDVPVDTVTAYLSPVLDVACANGDPQTVSGTPRDLGTIQGELVFPTGLEFQTRGDWTGVPLPVRSTERRAAYVFVATSNPLQGYQQPDPSQATTMDSPGVHGFSYSLSWYPGNLTLYALAGIEDTSVTPSRFIAYAMGVQRGVPVVPKTTTVQVDIKMDSLLDHAVQVQPKPPSPTYRGPDRVQTEVAVSLGQNAFAVLPNGSQTTLLPTSATLSFVGMPPLDHALTAESYVLNATAATGTYLQAPGSVISRVTTNNANGPVALTGFLPLPAPSSPGLAQWDGKTVSVGESAPFDLLELDVSSAGGLVTWVIVSPAKTAFSVPDLPAIDPAIGLRHGAIQSAVYAAKIAGFSYAKLRSGQLGSNAWSAYAFDVLSGAY